MAVDPYIEPEEAAPAEQPQEQQAERTPEQVAQQLFTFMESQNLAAEMTGIDSSDERNLDRIAQRVIDEYEIDLESRKEWLARNKTAMELAMLIAKEKNYPFENASNVRYPLLTVAALQFNARAYPAIVQGNRVVKAVTWGDDKEGEKAKRAERVSEHLSWQALAQMPEWEEDTDRLLLQLPILGCLFRKIYYDPSLGRKCSRVLTPDKVVVNYMARSIREVPRLTEELTLYPYEIVERIRSGRFVEFEYSPSDTGKETSSDDAGKSPKSTDDKDAPHLFLEQHRLLDLDGDGYPEPYIVTVHKATAKTCRIVANFGEDDVTILGNKVAAIRKKQYFIKYGFLPSPDGGIYDWGFGALLKDIGEAINTTINEMLDAGHLANVQGGLISSSLGIREKSVRLEMGEWRVIKTNIGLKDAIYPIKYDGPSPVLFQLLGMLVEAGRDVSAIKDVLTGEVRQNMTASATLALIEQGLQVFTAIFKRVHRALKAELGIHAEINRQHLSTDEYNAFFDGQVKFDPAADYTEKDMDILPVSDPSISSRMQELARAEFIMAVAKDNPSVNQFEATRRMFEAGQVSEIDALLVPPPQPDPETEWLMKIAAALELDDKAADILKKQTGAIKDLADADSKEGAGKLAKLRLLLEALKTEIEAGQNGQGRVPGMEGQPGDEMGAGPSGGALGGNGNAMPGPAMADVQSGDSGMAGMPGSFST